jgi:hypothetical protein
VLFVLGTNPISSEGAVGSETPDSPEVASEVLQHGDVLRVPAVHTLGNEGKAQLVHDLWRSLAALHDAQFYVKAQVRVSLSVSMLLLLAGTASKGWLKVLGQGNVFVVPAVHTVGSVGNAQLLHLPGALPCFEASYVKAQVRAVVSKIDPTNHGNSHAVLLSMVG